MAAGLPSAEEVVCHLIEKGADLKAINESASEAVITAAVRGRSAL
jgi:hypothetical protein